MTIKWVTPAGSLGVLFERTSVDIKLEAMSTTGVSVTFTLISGRLPSGIRLSNDSLRGSPSEVRKFTVSRFVIRASDGIDIEDRTFTISIDGADEPEWITREGFLQVGRGKAFFVLDNSKIDFQLEATDADIIAGDVLEFFLMPRGGELPPGLTLSKTGRITGFTDPIFSVEYSISSEGGYDINPFDVIPLDFREAKSNGFDSFNYDNFTYDYNEPSRVPRRLSRVYNFVVGVSDGLNVSTRLFKIYVVTEEFLKADNSIVQVGTNVFTADASSNRSPIWITESDLGRFRANNYVTIFLEVFNPPSLPGSTTLILLPNNPDGSESRVPNGMELDTASGLLAGYVPYQRKIITTYTFTLLAVYYPSSFIVSSVNFKGNWNAFDSYSVNDSVRFNNFIYVCIQSNQNKIPTLREFWVSNTTTTEKTFTVDVFGEIDSGIEWVSDNDLGIVRPNLPSDLSVNAKSLLPGGTVVYQLTKGKLPSGLDFLSNGIIKGKVKQFADDQGPGLTRLYELEESIKNFNVIYDGGTTSFDQKFTFTVKARDVANFAELEKTFSFKVAADSDKTFANLYIKPFQKKEKRLAWTNFITDVTIFPPEELYRYGDTNFSTQPELKMLIFAGIESVEATRYVQAMSKNHYRKRMLFGDIKIAKGKDLETQEVLYEVVYVEMIDEFEKNGESISPIINLSKKIKSPVLISYDAIKISNDTPFVSDRDHQRIFPNSIKNMRKQIRDIGTNNRNYLPLWMRSIQDFGNFETGFVKAVVICYAKPGEAEKIVSRIKASGFDFKSIDFVADRYLIDVIDGNIQDKYLAFPQRGEKLP